MKGKLIKTGNDYILRDLSGKVLGITIGEINGNLLHTTNCQAIERGYDVYELAKENYHKFWSVVDESEMLDHTFGYVEGFQKALEILGDRRFTEWNMLQAYMAGIFLEDDLDPDVEFKKYIQSLQQQNEWEVEILDERDSEGRLILKRV